ncbi:MAG: hypothetical protein CME71_06440 [Halobacteriovorax sp.]|nr:hypothetical protein [Halobacteriovorax sp.]|tara:strand:+ start:720 stop:1442 length:723 start_codon:yes stop_codon:yes gene_type:complete
MIYHNSNDPVLIKKIPLKIWTLRDELEAVIAARIESGEYSEDNPPSIEDLIAEYGKKVPMKRLEPEADEANLKLVPEEEESASDETEDVEQEATAETEVEKKDPVQVTQRRPKLSEDKIFNGTLVLAELEMDHLYFFSNRQFTPGQSIVIEFLIPKKFSMNVDIAYCRAFNLKSRIISSQNYRYRVAAKFTFLKEGERTLLRQFIKSVEPEVQKQVMPKITKGKAEETDDGFGDLDDLDI